MKKEFVERRRMPRVAIAGRVGSRVQSLVEATLVNLSLTGALVELSTLLRPGVPCELFILTGERELRLRARVVRSVVHRSVKKGRQVEFIYHVGIEFLDLSPEDREQLGALLRTFEAGGGASSGWKVLCLLV